MPERAKYLPWIVAAISLVVVSVSTAALTTIRVASGLTRPIFVAAPAGDDRLFIVEQRGIIKILKNEMVLTRPFLDIDSKVSDPASQNDERGLLGLAFSPNYSSDGRFYVNYINNSGETIIEEYYASSDPDSSNADSTRLIMEINQTAANHNGGTIAFGPNDGYLYIGMGDGGGSGDSNNQAQNLTLLLGKILRIDVMSGDPYSIPTDNPFINEPGVRDEIWASGLRNPSKWSFDRLTGDLWIGDVGQGSREEIDFQPNTSTGGENYGWRLMEGFLCFNPPTNCGSDTLTLPVLDIAHAGSICAVTGGYVYRGNDIPGLQGSYFFADFCSGQIWSIRYDGSTISDSLERTSELDPGGVLSIASIAGFGEDGHGELFIVDRGSATTGEIYKIIPYAVSVPSLPIASGRIRLERVFPNPFSRETRIEAVLGEPGLLQVEVTDVSGRRVRSLYSGRAEAGPVGVRWDGRDDYGRQVASGLYFVRARLNGEAAVQRVSIFRP